MYADYNLCFNMLKSYTFRCALSTKAKRVRTRLIFNAKWTTRKTNAKNV